MYIFEWIYTYTHIYIRIYIYIYIYVYICLYVYVCVCVCVCVQRVHQDPILRVPLPPYISLLCVFTIHIIVLYIIIHVYHYHIYVVPIHIIIIYIMVSMYHYYVYHCVAYDRIICIIRYYHNVNPRDAAERDGNTSKGFKDACPKRTHASWARTSPRRDDAGITAMAPLLYIGHISLGIHH